MGLVGFECTHEENALSTDAWLLALRLRDGARARALAEPRRITEAMRGVESAMACRFILLLQSSTRSCRSESDDSAVVAQLLWLLCERSRADLAMPKATFVPSVKR